MGSGWKITIRGVGFGSILGSYMSTERHITLVHEQSEFAEARSAEKAENARQCAVAARTVASHSNDAEDCTSLLAMLGLDALAGKQVGAPDSAARCGAAARV